MLSDERMKEIRAREQAATPGPWRQWDADINPRILTDSSGEHSAIAGNYDYDEGGIIHPADAVFIVHSRQDIPDLLAEVERLLAERDELVAALRHAFNHEDECDRCDEVYELLVKYEVKEKGSTK